MHHCSPLMYKAVERIAPCCFFSIPMPPLVWHHDVA